MLRVEPLDGQAARGGARSNGKDGGTQACHVDVAGAPERKACRRDAERALQLVGGHGGDGRHPGDQKGRQGQKPTAAGNSVNKTRTDGDRDEETDDLKLHRTPARPRDRHAKEIRGGARGATPNIFSLDLGLILLSWVCTGPCHPDGCDNECTAPDCQEAEIRQRAFLPG